MDKGQIHPDLRIDNQRSRIIGRGKDWFAVLDQEPKVRGHTLVISRSHGAEHPTDITAIKSEDIRDFFHGLVTISKRLKKNLRLGRFGKVYVMSMCEHWNDDEVDGKMHTEHLHFHLLPRYPIMRRKDMAGELLFVRPPSGGFQKARLARKDIGEYFKKMFTKLVSYDATT